MIFKGGGDASGGGSSGGNVNLSEVGGATLGSANVVDQVNQALRVNVVAGGGGGSSGSSTVFQGTLPWAVTGSGGQIAVIGSGGLFPVNGSVVISGSATVYQGSVPIPITGSGGLFPVTGSGGLIGTNLRQIGSVTVGQNAGICGSGTLQVVVTTANVVNISQVTVTGSVGGNQLASANANRIKIRITNTGNTACWIYINSSVNVSIGDYLAGVAGYPWISRFEGALYGFTGSGTQLVSVYEESSQ